MKTIKFIDLLNMISKGEEVPKKIIYSTFTYWYDEVEKDYYRYVANDLDDEGVEYLLESCFASDILNDEVEVCSTGLTVKEAEENLYKFSEALHKEANKKKKKNYMLMI